MIKCKICGKTLKNNISLGLHIRNEHSMSSKEYYDKYLRKHDDEGVCKTCGKRTNFISFTRGYAEHCSKACTQKDINVIKLRENTNIEKYGASNVFASDEIKERIKKNNLIKYGVEYTTTLKSTKDKQKATKLQRYGSETYNNAQKAKETCLERYGVSCGVQTLKAKQRAKESYNVENILQQKQENIEAFVLENDVVAVTDLLAKYGQGWRKKNLVPLVFQSGKAFVRECDVKTIEEYYCSANGKYSKHEKYIYDLIRERYAGKIVLSDTRVITPYSLDIYLPDLNLAFEYNGAYWHSSKFKEKDYHFNKSMMCLNNDIRLIHFYETLDSKLFIKDFINRIFTNTEEISNDFNKYSPLQFPHYSEVTYSGPKRLNYTEYDVYDSGSFTIIK